MTRAAWLALRDVVTVGVFHPVMLVWRIECAVRTAFGRGGRGQHDFAKALAARTTGQPPRSFVQGSTPWWVLKRLCGIGGVGHGKRFVDVGAGNGHAAAVISVLSQASGFAVEPVASLREGARASLHALGVPVVLAASIEEVPLETCSAAFASWTCWDRATRASVLEALTALPPGARLLTVTHPPHHPMFRLGPRHTYLFPWGPDDIFVAERM